MLFFYLFKEDFVRDEFEFFWGVLWLVVIKYFNFVLLRVYYLSCRNEKLFIFDYVCGKIFVDIIYG